MARIKGGMNAKKKHNRVLKLAKGYRGARSKQYRVAKQSVMRALTSSYAGRKQKKRQFRLSPEQLQLPVDAFSVQTALDRSYQRSSKNERSVLQQIYVWSETGRR